MKEQTSPARNSMRIIFMGTPEFAVESLKALVEAKKNIVAVITAPDKPKGRGQKLQPSPVKEYAQSQDIPVLQPTNLKDPDFLVQLASLDADLQIVVAFRMLPEAVWNMPPHGTFNLHASLLPQYRGAAPIHWAIINGEVKTGVTTFFLRHEIDTGKIIYQEEEPIHEHDTVGDLYERLMTRGADLVVKTVEAIQRGNYPQIPQDETGELKAAPKIFRETCEIDWSLPANKIHNFIRGLSPFPGAWTTINGQIVKVLRAHPLPTGDLKPGEWKTGQQEFLRFGTSDGIIEVDELQWQGKNRMTTRDYLRGNKIEP